MFVTMGKVLNQWIEQEIKERGWSLSELARRGEISQSFVSAVLAGKKNPGAKFYLGMSKAFGLPVDAIESIDAGEELPGLEAKPMSFAEWKAILERLDSTQRVALLRYALSLLLGREGGDDGED